MSEVIPFDQKNLPAELAGYFEVDEMGDDLSAGVAGGFAILSFRGSKWRIKSSGDETLVLNSDGEPAPSVELHFLKASADVSKVYYDHNYVEGSDEPPTCMSINGILPDADVSTPQAPSCAACEYNQWGSRMTDDGRKAKACSDSRRIAVTPAGDIANELYGGPMLLRVPAASLNDLKTYGLGMKNKGFPYNTIITRVGFDPDTSYPKLTFKPKRRITQEEAEALAVHYKGEKIEMILSVADESRSLQKQQLLATDKPVEKPAAVSLDFEEDEPAPAKAAAPKKAAAKKAEPVVEPTALDDDLDNILSKLESGA
jgi:hypothetical protein